MMQRKSKRDGPLDKGFLSRDLFSGSRCPPDPDDVDEDDGSEEAQRVLLRKLV